MAGAMSQTNTGESRLLLILLILLLLSSCTHAGVSSSTRNRILDLELLLRGDTATPAALPPNAPTDALDSAVEQDLLHLSLRRELVQLAPGNPRHHSNLGTLLMRLGHWELAYKAYAQGCRVEAAAVAATGDTKAGSTHSPSPNRMCRRDQSYTRASCPGLYDTTEDTARRETNVRPLVPVDAHVLYPGLDSFDTVYTTLSPVISDEECQWVIQSAESHAASHTGWSTERHASIPTTDIAINDIPTLLPWLNTKLEQVMFPLLGRLYGFRACGKFVCKVNAAPTYVGCPCPWLPPPVPYLPN